MDEPDIIEVDDTGMVVLDDDPVLASIRRDSRRLSDPRLRERLMGIVASGTPIPRAAEMCGVTTALVYRVLTADRAGATAIKEGERVRIQEVANRVHGMVGNALDVMSELMSDPDQDGKVRLDAAKTVINYSGTFPDAKGKSRVRGVSVEIGGAGDKDFAARLRTITVD